MSLMIIYEYTHTHLDTYIYVIREYHEQILNNLTFQ